jgi:hypothetical protein
VDTYSSAAPKENLEAITKATVGLKAVKADDAEVPVYLWNMRIIGENADERRAKALDGFRAMGLRLFWRALTRDCIRRLHNKFGTAWRLMATKTSSGKLTRVGKEREAMCNMLWHATQTTWFEYNCGSRI